MRETYVSTKVAKNIGLALDAVVVSNFGTTFMVESGPPDYFDRSHWYSCRVIVSCAAMNRPKSPASNQPPRAVLV